MSEKSELIEYISLLTKLKRDGFKCDLEMNQAIKQLHSLMLFDNKTAMNILVLESDREMMDKSCQVFSNIISGIKSVEKSINFREIKTEKIRVSIISVNDHTCLNAMRGKSFDYIINNTSESIPKIIQELGIRNS